MYILVSPSSAFCGIAPMTEEHISLAQAFDVPIIIVVTKTDICSPSQTEKTLEDLRCILNQPNRNKVSTFNN